MNVLTMNPQYPLGAIIETVITYQCDACGKIEQWRGDLEDIDCCPAWRFPPEGWSVSSEGCEVRRYCSDGCRAEGGILICSHRYRQCEYESRDITNTKQCDTAFCMDGEPVWDDARRVIIGYRCKLTGAEVIEGQECVARPEEQKPPPLEARNNDQDAPKTP